MVPKTRRKGRAATTAKAKTRIGWREWAGLPALGVDRIKAKMDTGARTSAIHAFHVEEFEREGQRYVRFKLHPVQNRRKPEIECEAPVLEVRSVTSSSGQQETRFVIETELVLGGESRLIELTLANRDQLGFRMLIGRQALRSRYVIDPGSSYRLERAGNEFREKKKRSRKGKA